MDDGSGSALPDPSTVAHYHSDMIGTLRNTTDPAGAPTTARVFTAFGEPMTQQADRYGYAGAWGYQTHRIDEVDPPLDPDTVFPFLHVGARYYDPSTARFLQRDPIGIAGGLNVYLYVGANPLVFTDPDGLSIAGIDGTVQVGTPPFPPTPPSSGGGKKGGMSSVLACAVGVAVSDGPQPGPADAVAVGVVVVVGVIIVVKGVIDIVVKRTHRKNKSKSKADRHRRGEKRKHQRRTDKKRQKPDWVPHNCFVAGTQVLMDDGARDIQDVAVGDFVFSVSADVEGESSSHVMATFDGTACELVVIELGAETLRCTGEHPFWVLDHGWVWAANLSSGDTLIAEDGGSVPIMDVRFQSLTDPVPVYNITVDGEHAYFVGKKRVLVHNKPP